MFSVRVPGGAQVRPLQPRHRLGKGVARAQHDAAAVAQLAEQRRQRDQRADAAAAVAAALEPVARREHQRIGLGQPSREGQRSAPRAARTPPPRAPPAIRARRAMNSSKPEHVRGDERRRRTRPSVPARRPATRPAARRCRAAAPDAGRPARRSWCAADRPPPACRPCASPGGCSAPDAGWRPSRCCPRRRSACASSANSGGQPGTAP